MTRSSLGPLLRIVAVYSVLRLGIVVLLAFAIFGVAKLIGIPLPLIVAALFAVVVQLPLSMVVFKSIRRRLNEEIAVVDEHRRTEKAALRARLSGEAQ